MKFNFGTIEVTIQEISDATENFVDALFDKACEQIEAENEVRKAIGDKTIALNDDGVKRTVALVQAVIDADDNINQLRMKAEKLKFSVSCLRQRIEGNHDDRRLLTSWLNSQTSAGIQG